MTYPLDEFPPEFDVEATVYPTRLAMVVNAKR